MNLELSNSELLYLYGNLKKELTDLQTVKPASLVKSDIKLHQSIIQKIETVAPQLKNIPT